MDTPTGLRERKKAATRQAVHEAALRLTVEHGIENVTVEAIADAAGISRRTFSNYFANKEEALLFGDTHLTALLLAAVRERPARESAWAALRAGAHAVFLEQDHLPREPEWAVRTRLAMRHPSLHARQLAARLALENDLAEAVAGRPGTETVRPRVIAAVFLAMLRLATAEWIELEGGRTVMEILDELLDEAARPLL
ncbi:TetR/AcrR family transcriptional regulator [Streptomyces avicenniae]|uniref:TetR/AcrR family transcriptional regulator n=1 Tax=Streptomyces avicenniae TaxID=500153 RepID=UPI00069B41E7|nr:TetR/AcrR family transcriptional regulator [Streptomyces avicenniae]